MFYFPPADIVSQILNFGLPAPIDIQIMGRDVDANHQFANNLMAQLSSVTGIADLRIQQPFNQPKLHINVDRTKTLQAGFTQRDVAGNLLVSLSGSFQTSPSFWLDPKSGVSYIVATQAPQYEFRVPAGPREYSGERRHHVRRGSSLGNLGTITRGDRNGHRFALRRADRDRHFWIDARTRLGRRGARDVEYDREPESQPACRADLKSFIRGQIDDDAVLLYGSCRPDWDSRFC